MAERSKAPDCNSGDFYLRRFESFSSHRESRAARSARQAHDLKVVGSNPTSLIIYSPLGKDLKR